MLLLFPNGQPFATGANSFTPFLPEQPEIFRIVIDVEIAGLPLRAVVDTGAPYLICKPKVAEDLGLGPQTAVGTERLIIRARRYAGTLHRLPIRFFATQGEDVTVEATVFAPELPPEEIWTLPNFIGLTGVLERMRFAVDPGSDLFYFGPLA